jgi:hypothetical protein
MFHRSLGSDESLGTEDKPSLCTHHPPYNRVLWSSIPTGPTIFHNSIRKDAAERLSAWSAACCRSGITKIELRDHLYETDSRVIDQLFATLLGLANGIHGEIYSQNPFYLSYTSDERLLISNRNR